MSILKKLLILIPTVMLLSACGGGDDCVPSDGRPLDTTTDTSATCAETRAANTIIIAYPVTDAIEQLSGAGAAAIYSLKGTAIVTDQNGNAVSDNTVVQLDVFDTLIARGIIAGGDSIAGSLITDNTTPFQGDRVTATSLNTTTVTRSGSLRTIIPGDLVILQNAASIDKIRYVVSTTANSITVNTPYVNSYPSATYPAAEYLVGQALIGTSILGIDETGNKSAGVALTKDGLANFRLEHPGDSEHLNYGLVDYAVLASGTTDPRTQYSPDGSTEVWVIANVGAGVAVADRTVLTGIADTITTVDSATATIASGTKDIIISVEDAKNVSYPLVGVSATSSDEDAATVTGCLTDETGSCTATITWVATAATNPITITFTAFGQTAEVALTVN